MRERIKELRITLGFTMEKFGERLGVTKQTISRIENGVNNLTEQMLKLICNVNWDGKRVNEDWLRGNSDEMFVEESDDGLKALLEKYQLTDDEYNFLKGYFDLEPSSRKNLIEALKRIFSTANDDVAPDTADKPAKPQKKKRTIAGIDPDGLSDTEFGAKVRNHLGIEEKVEEKSEASSYGD